MNTLWRDTRLGLGMLRPGAGLTGSVVLTLALGIGAATTIFNVVNGILLESLPYTNPEQLVEVVSRFVVVTSSVPDCPQRSHDFES